MPASRRIDLARALMLTVLAVITGLVFAAANATWVTVPAGQVGPVVESPAGPVGSGLHLPLGGGR